MYDVRAFHCLRVCACSDISRRLRGFRLRGGRSVVNTAVSRNKKPLSCYAVSHASMGGTKGAKLYLGKDGSVWYAGGFRLRAFDAGERVGPLLGP